jgi:hypothetical protein
LKLFKRFRKKLLPDFKLSWALRVESIPDALSRQRTDLANAINRKNGEIRLLKTDIQFLMLMIAQYDAALNAINYPAEAKSDTL